MKRLKYIDYHREGGVITIIITEPDGSKGDKFTANIKDEKTTRMISATLYSKYGIDLNREITIPVKEDNKTFFNS